MLGAHGRSARRPTVFPSHTAAYEPSGHGEGFLPASFLLVLPRVHSRPEPGPSDD